MESPASFFSASGRIAPKPFVLGALAIYVASFLSQFLLAAPVTEQASVIPFLAVQIAIAWVWYALHVKRLRDAGRATGPAAALTVLYALAIVLLLLVMVAASVSALAATSEEVPAAGIFQIFLPFYLVGVILGDPNLGMFGYVILVVLALVTLPVLIAVVFTIWIATMPSAPAAR